MKTKKITFISLPGYHYYNPTYNDNVFGGAELQIYLITSELAKYPRYKINVLVTNDNKEKKEIIKNIKVTQAFNAKKYKTEIIRSYKLYKSLKNEKPDLIFKRGHGKSLIVTALYKLLHPKVKIIYNIASILDINDQRFKGFFGKLTFLAMKLVDVIIVQTQDQYNLLNNKNKKKVPENGIIRNIYNYDNITEKKGGEYVLWVSRCTKIKKPELFLKLVKKFPNSNFVMISPRTDKELWAKIEQKTKKINNLKFIESVPYKEIGEYFKKAKIFINTSTHEGYPNTFLQSAETNTPILSLNVNPDKILDKYKIGINCKDDFKLMESYLNKLLKNKGFYNGFLNNGKTFLKAEHDKNSIFKKFLNIFDNL